MLLNEAIEIDLFNFYSIQIIEAAGNPLPKQVEIDRVEYLLKQGFEQYAKKILKKFIAMQETPF